MNFGDDAAALVLSLDSTVSASAVSWHQRSVEAGRRSARLELHLNQLLGSVWIVRDVSVEQLRFIGSLLAP